MGGFGSISIAITYPTLFMAAAFFNAVLDAHPCMFFGYCHSLCGVDSMDCDMKWVTVGVAFTPYVMVKQDHIMSSTGAFDPVAYGVAVLALDATGNDAKCTNSATSEFTALASAYNSLTGDTYTVGATGASITSTAGAEGPIAFNGGGSKIMTDSNIIGGSLPPFRGSAFMSNPRNGLLTSGYFFDMTLSYSAAPAQTSYFYLNQVQYTMSAQHFLPPFDPSNDSILLGNWNAHMAKQPLHRVRTQKGFDGSDILLLMSTDHSDPYHLDDQLDAFANCYMQWEGEGTASFGTQDVYQSTPQTFGARSKGGMIADGEYGEACGHCMNVRDFYVAIAFFADVFDTWTDCSFDTDYRNRAVTVSISQITSVAEQTSHDNSKAWCFTYTSRLAGSGLRPAPFKRYISGIQVASMTAVTVNGKPVNKHVAQYLTQESMALTADQFATTATRTVNILVKSFFGTLNALGGAARCEQRVMATVSGCGETCVGAANCDLTAVSLSLARPPVEALSGVAAVTTLSDAVNDADQIQKMTARAAREDAYQTAARKVSTSSVEQGG
jgi:hypothetical protein